jgi:hypothetical protein
MTPPDAAGTAEQLFELVTRFATSFVPEGMAFEA